MRLKHTEPNHDIKHTEPNHEDERRGVSKPYSTSRFNVATEYIKWKVRTRSDL